MCVGDDGFLIPRRPCIECGGGDGREDDGASAFQSCQMVCAVMQIGCELAGDEMGESGEERETTDTEGVEVLASGQREENRKTVVMHEMMVGVGGGEEGGGGRASVHRR